MRHALVALSLVVFAGGGGTAQELQISPGTVEGLERWAGHVMSHVPGQADASVRAVWSLTFEDRKTLHPGMALLLDAVAGKRVTTRSPLERRIADLGAELARNPGAAGFIKRAAVLHGDAAIIGYVSPLIRPVPAGAPLPMSRPAGLAAPLLTARPLWLENDGQVIGMSVSDWNWIFARSLLDRLKPPGADPFVGQWYHATIASMFQNRMFGEVQWHLEHAAEMLPNDARILLDRGCSEEQQGLPRSQGALSDADIVTLRMQKAGMPSRTGRSGSVGLNLGIKPIEISNRAAEGFYRRAVERDPRLFEARVRLARLLTLRSKYAEALEVITVAPAGTAPDVIAEYYAHLFAARAERGLGRLDFAASRIRQARDLFPGAQSALMAASHIAMLRADEAGAEEPMRHLALLSFERTYGDDPWWIYETFTGRYADALIAEMWKNAASVSK
jgi:tetratricopeptide (TPR) repeat protein